MVLEKDRQELEKDLQEATWYAAKQEIILLKCLSKPMSYKNTWAGKFEEEHPGPDRIPLPSQVDREVMEEVDALAWMSFIDPHSIGNALPDYYGRDVVSYQEGQLRPAWAEARVDNLYLAQCAVVKKERQINTATQRVHELLGRKHEEIMSEFDRRVLSAFLGIVGEDDKMPENPEAALLPVIYKRVEIFQEQIKLKIDRAYQRMQKISEELSVYKNIPHEKAVTITLQVHKTFGYGCPQTLIEAGAEDHIQTCYSHPLCLKFHDLYGYSADYLSDEGRKKILGEIEQELQNLPLA